MFTFSILLTIFAVLIFLIWVSRYFMIRREKNGGFVLSEDYSGPPTDAPGISVVVAAKDEQDNIEACLRTMLKQDYPNYEIIVCNDRSDDDTAAIVERIAAEDSRVRLINIDHLPGDWCGKNHAMQHGIKTAKHEWICMIDADCEQDSTRTLSIAIQYALDKNADLLSVLPVLKTQTFWEDVVQPVCGGVMMIWFHPDKVNNPEKPNAYANGAFMLMKRSAYEAIGTHEAVKDRVNEDMHIASCVKGSGLNLRVVRNKGLYQVRMYTSLKQIIRGWSRIFYGTFGTLKRLSLSITLLMTVSMLPYISMVLGFSMAGANAPSPNWWLACGIIGTIAATLQLYVINKFYRMIGSKGIFALAYPLGCVITLLSLIIALGKLRPGAQVVWRNTSYSST